MSDARDRIQLRRQAVRILPLNERGDVLLLQCVRPQALGEPFWVTIGGGLESGEDERAAGVRELWEETGLEVDPSSLVGPLHEEVVEFSWGEYDIVQHQRYYLARVASTEVTFDHLEEVEIATTLDYRWWSLDDLRATTEHVIDNQRQVVTDALAPTGLA